MIFKDDASIDGKLVYGYERGWHWSRDGGHYHKNRDFFWVHWEIGGKNPNSVKLHGESPRREIDPELNGIKQEIVKEFLSPRFQKLVEQHGFRYKKGTRTKMESMEKNKCTSPFHVILSEAQREANPRSNIEKVNAILSEEIGKIVHPFQSRLNSLLSME